MMTPKRPNKKNTVNSYDEFKEFEGQKYTGMKIGGSHKWYYDEGEWRETKVTPDLWQIHYEVTKRRAGKAPEGSGVPVGTSYHWYIVAHQNVQKLDANNYLTSMTGLKLKLAHKRADKEAWSASETNQKKRLIEFFEELIMQLKAELLSPSKVPKRAVPKKKAAALKRKAIAHKSSSAKKAAA